MSKVLVLNDYESNEIIDIKFDIDSCVEWVKNNISMEWVEEESVEDLSEGGGNDEEDMGNGVLGEGKLEEEMGLIVVDYMMFCCEMGWIDVRVNFVKK